jgi:hypothetical protein
VLQSLAGLYSGGLSDPNAAFDRGLHLLQDGHLEGKLRRDSEAFQYRGLDNLSKRQRHDLIGDYQAIDHAVAREVVDWLSGEYQFDPACLTD